MQTKRLVAVVPARAGSKGLKGKNKKLLGGRPLFEWSYAAGCLMDVDTYVSTNDEEIMNYCIKHGIQFIKRPDPISEDSSLDIGFLLHLMDQIKIVPIGYSIINLRPTSPLRTRADIKKFKDLALYADGSIRSVELSDFPVQKMWFRNENGQLESVIDTGKMEYYNMPRQKLRPSYKQTGSFDSYRVEDIESGRINGEKIFGFEQSIPTHDIDHIEDFVAAEKFYSNNKELFDY